MRFSKDQPRMGRGKRKDRRRGRLVTQAVATFALVVATAVVAPAVADSSQLPPIPVFPALTTNSGSLSTSVGSNLLLVARITGQHGGYLLGSGAPASVSFLVVNAEFPNGVRLCSDVTTYSLTTG